jgi:hypothetical protein
VEGDVLLRSIFFESADLRPAESTINFLRMKDTL